MDFGVQHQPWGFSQMILEAQQTVYDLSSEYGDLANCDGKQCDNQLEFGV